MTRAKLLGILGLIAGATPAWAAPVYPGCAVPALKPGHHTFIVDPTSGSMSGDGSAAKPWSTLADVLNPANKLVETQAYAGGKLNTVNPDAPVKPGDVLLLKTGNHGSPALWNMNNADFITVKAAPGAVPVISQLTVASSAKWLFQGLTFEGGTNAPTGAAVVKMSAASLIQVINASWIGPSSDIAFNDDVFRTAASTAGWTPADWYNKPYATAMTLRAPCVAVAHSHINNVLNAIYITAPRTLIEDDDIEGFSNDAIDVVSSDVLIRHNTIGNSTTVNGVDPMHPDAIQGWSYPPTAVNSNVVIDGNIVSEPRDPKQSQMMGIDVFDGRWSGLVVENNVVTTNHWNGIVVFGGDNSRILNNTVVAADPVHFPSIIQVHPAKDGTPATALVRNNIATQILAQGAGVTVDHNLASAHIVTTVKDPTNVVDARVLDGFVNPAAFDLRLKPTSAAVGKGLPADAPPVDRLGRKRAEPVDLGAYVHEAR